MKKKVGIIVLNYNKKEYLLRCLNSLMKQTYKDFDVLVIDNASSDGSAEAVLREYGKKVELLKLEENLGGSGGFCAGLRELQKKEYEYYLLLDNDVELRENCLAVLHGAMVGNPDIGIIGAKILLMDQPDIIQEFGPMLNYRTFFFDVCFRGERGDISLPDIRGCDYVPACVMMVRGEAMEKIGIMPEENYLYFDDIEWCTRCRRAGFRVAAHREAIAWHKGGAGIAKDTASVYYMNRNKTAYYLRHLPEMILVEKEENRSEIIMEYAGRMLDDMFQGLFVCKTRNLWNIYMSRMEGFLDALAGKRGKAESYKIRPRDEEDIHPGNKRLGNISKILLHMNGERESTRLIIFELRKLHKGKTPIDIILVEDSDYRGDSLLGLPVREKWPEDDLSQYLILEVCNHVLERGKVRGRNYVDRWRNLLLTDEDFAWYESYQDHYEMFKQAFMPRLTYILENRSKEILGEL